MMYVGLCFGPMFAGKSTYLQTKYRQFSKNVNNRILVVKPLFDKRYEEHSICTHTGQKIPAIGMDDLSSIDYSKWDVILIDEAQWFNDLYSFIYNGFVNTYNIENIKSLRVYIAGLSGDKNQKKFGEVLDIIPMCSEIISLTSPCDVCGEMGSFTKCKIISDKRDLIGAEDLYYTVCNKHLS